MRRFGQVIRLKPDRAGEYIKYHSAVWSAVLQRIKECNISNYSIFHKDNILFAYMEYTGADYEGDMQKMAQHNETQKWWNVVKPLMQPVENRKPGEFWADMEEIFHLE